MFEWHVLIQFITAFLFWFMFFFVCTFSMCSEAVTQRCSVKKVFLEISQNSQENTCGPKPATLLKKKLWHRCFPVNFAKFLRTPFLTEYLRWLLLYVHITLFPFSHHFCETLTITFVKVCEEAFMF